MILLQLFLAFFQIGALSFGGGYAALSLIQAQVIDKYGWLTVSDFSDLCAIAEMTPGPIAVNAATFTGHQTAGFAGALVATTAVILPSCLFVTLLACLYTRYRRLTLMQGILRTLRPTVVAMIFSAGLTILIPALFSGGTISFSGDSFRIRSAVLFAAALLILRLRKKTNPILVMAGCGNAELIAELVLPAA